MAPPPVEKILENNSITSGESIKLVDDVEFVDKFDLDYNVLSRDISFPLIDGKEIKANLDLPKGEWIGPAKGELNIDNSSAAIYNNFSTSPTKVNEHSSIIKLKPTINATLQRSDFNDNPPQKKYINLDNPYEPLIKTAKLTFDNVQSCTAQHPKTLHLPKHERRRIPYQCKNRHLHTK